MIRKGVEFYKEVSSPGGYTQGRQEDCYVESEWGERDHVEIFIENSQTQMQCIGLIETNQLALFQMLPMRISKVMYDY